jgi:hypothetical protein
MQVTLGTRLRADGGIGDSRIATARTTEKIALKINNLMIATLLKKVQRISNG